MGRARTSGRAKRDLLLHELPSILATAKARLNLAPEQKKIGEGETFVAWCERLASNGLKVDGRPFRLDDRPAMRWVYEQVPSTLDEAYRSILVLQKSAQVGFTVMEILATIYLALRFGAGAIGMFVPDQQLAELKSSERFMPIIRSCPELHALMRDADTGRLDEGNVTRRRLAGSLFVYLWTSGATTTESLPMDILSLDEVQGMTLEQIEKVYERLSASPVRFMLMGSTANWPEADINHWYRRGSQHRFHTRCPTCSVAKPLDDYFPSCIARDAGGARYVCPNGHTIEDPQCGEWVAERPEFDPPIDKDVPRKQRPLRIRSIHFPQMLSPTIAAGEILDAYNAATDLKSFHNRKLGKPYLDPSQTPVTLEHLNACVRAGRAAGVTWKARANDTYMGVDQMGNFNVVWIKERRSNGRQAVVHVEEIYSDAPFDRCADLMSQYGVRIAVVELNPNYNDAKRFANAFPGRVFICNSFGKLDDDMIQWGDQRALNTSERRTEEEARDRYTVRMDQYKCMQSALARFVRSECLMPDPQGLVQDVIDKGVKQQAAVLPRAFAHFTKTALVNERDEEAGTNQYRRVVRKIGVDPHHSYANMLCDVAMARAYGTAMFILPEVVDASSITGGGGLAALPGLPSQVANLLEEVGAKASVCAMCASYQVDSEGRPLERAGQCSLRNFTTQASDPACELLALRS